MDDNRVIMDTNVLFAGLYSSTGASHQVLRFIDSGRIKPVISVTLLFEYEDVLRRNCEKLQISDRQIDVILDNLCALSDFQKIYFLWRPYLRDPKDDHVLEVAVASQTQRIITHNLKDFEGSEKFGIQAISPRKLLEMTK
ncbi:MAG: putative toxin-antitoxin system toxin component, PIN family [Proteobacteria bacterium]|nr:putative toxin-antitoxin system toxin component, PIN family [Pseudomonadota bacterium]